MEVNDQLHAPSASPHDRQLEKHQEIIAEIKIPYLRGMKPQLSRPYKVTLLSDDLSVTVKEGPMPILRIYHRFYYSSYTITMENGPKFQCILLSPVVLYAACKSKILTCETFLYSL